MRLIRVYFLAKCSIRKEHPIQLSQAPRPLTLPIQLQVLFGSFLSQFGWFFVWFGLIFSWIFASDMIINSFRFQGEFKSAHGAVQSSVQVGSSGSRRSGNWKPILGHDVMFEVEGQSFSARGYTTGTEVAPGTPVTVFYKASQPSIARIEGMRTGAFDGPASLITLFFPLVGLFLALPAFFQGLRSIRLLRSGQLAKARLVKREPANMRVNNQQVWKLIFSFTVKGKIYEHIFQTHLPESVTDEAEETLLYDSARPEYSVLLDGLPGGTRIDPQTGQLTGPHLISSLLLLLQPALAVTVLVVGWQIKGF